MKVLDFFNEVRVELSKVVWPSRAQTIQLTVIVVLVTIVVGFFLFGVDFLLQRLMNFYLFGNFG
jgi:preprotein translocase subunit SecE